MDRLHNRKKLSSLFDRASIRAKVKIGPGRLYSRNKVDKPKRHHVFRRVCLMSLFVFEQFSNSHFDLGAKFSESI